MPVEKSFFKREAEEVARDLLGAVIIRNGIKAKIVETEAYLEDDPASHAHPEKTSRNRLMYETYGRVYIYICYGIHYMLNFTCEEDGVGGVLIRALEPLEGIENMKQNRGVENEEKLCNGPGKLCEALGIDKNLNGTEIGENLELEQGEVSEIEKSPRIGITKAVDRELRFYIPGNSYVSTR